jgi:N-acetylneuraminate lyase
VDALISWLQPIAAAAPNLPLFYYHIPGTTGVNIQIFDLLTAAQTTLPQLYVPLWGAAS